jgi:putative transposase
LVVDGWRPDQGAIVGFKKTSHNPTDRGKQGIKRSVLTEAAGLPIALVIDGTNRNDMKRVKPTLGHLMVEHPLPTAANPQELCLDKGYALNRPNGISP